jgi:hypothetical protein
MNATRREGSTSSAQERHAAWIRRSIGLGPVHPAADIGLDERFMLWTERLTGGLR